MGAWVGMELLPGASSDTSWEVALHLRALEEVWQQPSFLRVEKGTPCQVGQEEMLPLEEGPCQLVPCVELHVPVEEGLCQLMPWAGLPVPLEQGPCQLVP